MLAVVREPHTEISLSGTGACEMLALLRSKYQVDVLDHSPVDDGGELVEIHGAAFGKKYGKRLLAGYRLKADLTQERLAELSGVSQNVISEYETGKRRLTRQAAAKFAKALGVEPERLLPRA